MTPEEQIVKMTKAINQAIKVLGDSFGSTPQDHDRAIQALRESMQKDGAPAVAAKPAAPKVAAPETPAAT